MQRKPRHLFFPAHKATKLFTTHDAIKHITPKHSKAINLEGYYFFWQETSRRSSSAGHGTVKPPASCLEFPPFFPPLLGHLRLLLLASSPATSASTRYPLVNCDPNPARLDGCHLEPFFAGYKDSPRKVLVFSQVTSFELHIWIDVSYYALDPITD